MRGRFEVKTKHIRRVRLLLDATMFEPGKKVEAVFNGKNRRKKPLSNNRVLCLEFAERFDRTFLPIAYVDLP